MKTALLIICCLLFVGYLAFSVTQAVTQPVTTSEEMFTREMVNASSTVVNTLAFFGLLAFLGFLGLLAVIYVRR